MNSILENKIILIDHEGIKNPTELIESIENGIKFCKENSSIKKIIINFKDTHITEIVKKKLNDNIEYITSTNSIYYIAGLFGIQKVIAQTFMKIIKSKSIIVIVNSVNEAIKALKDL